MNLTLNDLFLTHGGNRLLLKMCYHTLERINCTENTLDVSQDSTQRFSWPIWVVVVKCRRGNIQEAECTVAPAEDLVLERWLTPVLSQSTSTSRNTFSKSDVTLPPLKSSPSVKCAWRGTFPHEIRFYCIACLAGSSLSSGDQYTSYSSCPLLLNFF